MTDTWKALSEEHESARKQLDDFDKKHEKTTTAIIQLAEVLKTTGWDGVRPEMKEYRTDATIYIDSESSIPFTPELAGISTIVEIRKGLVKRLREAFDRLPEPLQRAQLSHPPQAKPPRGHRR